MTWKCSIAPTRDSATQAKSSAFSSIADGRSAMRWSHHQPSTLAVPAQENAMPMASGVARAAQSQRKVPEIAAAIRTSAP